MVGEALELNPTRLVIAAIVGLAVLLLLIIVFKVQAMVAILVGGDCHRTGGRHAL